VVLRCRASNGLLILCEGIGDSESAI